MLKSLLAWGFRLTFHRANYVLILRFSQKNVTFMDLWHLGVPLGKRFKQGYQKGVPNAAPKMSHFEQREALGPSQKTLNFRSPPKRLKGGTRPPKGAKGCPKGSIFEVFLVPFGVRCQECKMCSRLGGSLIFEVPGYPKAAHFS